VRAQNDSLRPVEPLAPSPVLERRFERGRDFEADVLAEMVKLLPEMVILEAPDAASLEAATSEAIEHLAPVIASGRLPADHIGRRVGKPDLLVKARAGGYRAVDIKHHMALEPAVEAADGLAATCSELGLPSFEDAEIDASHFARRKKSDLLQLAHYQRMLEAAGIASNDGARYGGIVGVERCVVWYDLDAPIWRTPSSSGKQKARTTMEIYDFEFDFRLDIIAAAQDHERDPATPLLVVPVRIGECDECPWWDHCRPQLKAGTGDVSLIPRVGWRPWSIHREHGVNDRAALAALNIRTARLIAAGVDLAGLMEATEGMPPDTPIAAVPKIARRKAQVAKLEATGIVTVGDISTLHPETASYSGAMSSLPEQIDQARAALGTAPVYRRRNVESISVPRADVEVDIDMENVEEGVYLWGALLTDRKDTSSSVGERHQFVTWEALTKDVETHNFVRFWEWLSEVRRAAAAGGLTLRAYCYNEAAENTYLRSLGSTAGVIDEVETFIASDEWVDVLRVFDSQLITGGPNGLKVVAPLAGFSWDIDDPGGGESMLRYEIAVASPSQDERDSARAWLLAYNGGDVAATLAIRDWLERESTTIPSIDSLDAVEWAESVHD
jgi:predicted RecB family nuclease